MGKRQCFLESNFETVIEMQIYSMEIAYYIHQLQKNVDEFSFTVESTFKHVDLCRELEEVIHVGSNY